MFGKAAAVSHQDHSATQALHRRSFVASSQHTRRPLRALRGDERLSGGMSLTNRATSTSGGGRGQQLRHLERFYQWGCPAANRVDILPSCVNIKLVEGSGQCFMSITQVVRRAPHFLTHYRNMPEVVE